MSKKNQFTSLGKHIFLIPFSFITLVPLIWIVVTAFKRHDEVFSKVPRWFPENPTFANFVEVLDQIPFFEYGFNSVVVVFGTFFFQCILITLAAYAFARFNFKGRDFLFLLLLLQLMIAPQSVIIENYFTLGSMGLLDTKFAIMAPYLASAYGVFLLRQNFKILPRELEDAARMDGCGGLRYLWHIAIPMLKPTYLAFGLVSMTYHWNEFFWPLIVTESEDQRTMTLGLGILAQTSEGSADWTVLMAATLMVIAIPVLCFVIFQRQFIESFMHSGIKG